jgi:tyrosyl-tRNA synthetase
VNFPAKAFYLLKAVGIASTSTEARLRILAGGVRLDGERLSDPNQIFESPTDLDGRILKYDRKTFRRLVNQAGK